MPSLLESCTEYFGSDNLYSILEIEKSANESEVKRGYYKLSLKVHPDRVPDSEKDEATKKFQTLAKIYVILGDKDKRALYDETGEIDDEDDTVKQDRDWEQYWRLLFHKVTVDDITEFEKNYKNSAEELDDLKSAYVEAEGDMDTILDSVMCATIEDEDRFRKILKGLIKEGAIPEFSNFSGEDKKKKKERKKRAEKEAKEAEKMADELGMNENDSLKALIQKKNRDRAGQMESFFSQLEEKYAPKSKKEKKEKSASAKPKGRKKKS